MAALAKHHQRTAEQDGEQQNLQYLALGEGADDRVGDNMQDEIHRFHLARLLGEAGDGRCVRLAGKADAGLYDIGDDQAERESEGRDDLEIDERLDRHAADLRDFGNMRDARHDRAEDDRRDHHFDQLYEAVAHRLDPLVLGEMREQPAHDHAEHDGDENLDVEQFVERLAFGGRRRGGG